MGTKFAHFSIQDISQAKVKELLRLLPPKTSSLFARLNKINPGLGDKMDQAITEFSKMPPDDPRVSMMGNQKTDNKRAMEYLHSTKTVYYIAQNNEWTTVCNEEFGFESIESNALEMSKRVTNLIMSIADFDDDVFILLLSKNGKTITQHISGSGDDYGMKDTLGDIAAMADNLKIKEKGKERELESILKEKDIWKKFEKLEKLLNMQLWIPKFELEQKNKGNLNWQKVTSK
jgi:hypothetical protein